MSATRDPRSKAELIDRLMSYDFDGDIRHLGKQDAVISRVKGHVVKLKFPDSGKEFELSVRLPRGPRKVKKKAANVNTAKPKTVSRGVVVRAGSHHR